jgi:UDP-glucose:glycoprotein glucosyltransferase
VYDSEIAQFTRKLADQGLIRSQAAAADTNALANAAAASGGTALPADADGSGNPPATIDEGIGSVATNKEPRDEL